VSIFYQFKIQEGVINLKQNGRSKNHLQMGQEFFDYEDSGGLELEVVAQWLVPRFADFRQDNDASSLMLCQTAIPTRQMARCSIDDDSLNHNE
jgi:hypothetical protein